MANPTVKQKLQAEIRRLTAENEAFRHEAEAYREMKAEYEILLARSQQEATQFVGLLSDISRLTAENERLREALRGVEPYLDAIVCYASTMGEHEGNRIAVQARAALQLKEGAA